MPVDIANFVANRFRAPDPAQIDRAKYTNALLRNEIAQAPVANERAQLENQALQAGLGEKQKATAAGLLANRFAAVASSQSPKMAAKSFLSDPNFRAAGALLGLPVDQFSVTDADTDEAIRAAATDWSRALGADPGQQQNEYGLTPQFGVDASGNPIMLQVGKNGRAIQTQMPPNVRLSKEPIKIDAGTKFILLDPITRQPVGEIAKDLQGAAQAEATGRAEAERIAGQPAKEEAQAEVAGLASALLSSPGLDAVFGTIQGAIPSVRQGTIDAEADVDRLVSMLSLENRQKLKGSGAISDFESKTLAKAASVLSNKRISETKAREALRDIADILGPVGGDQTIPEGIDPGVWQYMTPEERKLWQ